MNESHYIFEKQPIVILAYIYNNPVYTFKMSLSIWEFMKL